MDPVSHLLFGRTVALTIRRRPSPDWRSRAALVLGSILPDVDAALTPRGFDLYLRAHASGTHSLLGTVVEALVLALVLRMLVSGSRVLPLLVSLVGGRSSVTSSGISPTAATSTCSHRFSDAMLGWHLVAMGEPIVLATLTAAALARLAMADARAQRSAAAALVLLSVLLAAKKTTQEWARARYAESVANEAPGAIAIAPRPRTSGRMDDLRSRRRPRAGLERRRMERRGDVGVRVPRRGRRAGGHTVASSFRSCATFLGLSKIPFVRMERDGSRRLVLWSDVSSCSSRGCDVSFGGAFDGNMAPLYQLIRIGGFNQRRSVPPGQP